MTRFGRTIAVIVSVAGLAACSSPLAPPGPPVPPVVDPATAPIIRSVTVPAARVEAGQDVAVSAVVEDAETPLAQLAYHWSATAGSISGSGASAIWRMPVGATSGVNVAVTLTITDTYNAVENNVIVKRQFVVSKTAAPFRAHDSLAEMKELARRFLVDLFGNSSVPVEDCLVDFSDVGRCAGGKKAERTDITDHRKKCIVQQARILTQNAFFTVDNNNGRVDNTAEFIDTCKPGSLPLTLSAKPMDSTGNYWVTTFYDDGRWWLCSSEYDELEGPGTSGLAQIKRRRGGFRR